MPDSHLELILHQLDDLPTLPAVAVRVLDATGRDDTAAADVTRLLESDPALSARILKLVHRADLTARGGGADTVARAVALLGFDAVRCATLAVAVYQTLGGSTQSSAAASSAGPNVTPFDRAAFWTHALAVACCADLLATRLPVRDVAPATAFLCGLLHDVGKVALDAALPKSFARVVEAVDLLRGNIADVERQLIGVDHMTAGRRLAERWRLPDAVADVAWLHGQPPAALPKGMKNGRLVNLVTLADLLVRQQHLGYSGNYVLTDRGPVLAALGLSDADADAVVAALVGHMEPRATALGLNQATGDELYRSALTRANRELGQIGSQLAAKNRRLATRSKYFDAGQAFGAELRPDSSPADVLRAVAHTAATLLGTSAVAAFSLPPGDTTAEAALVDAAGALLDLSDLKLDLAEFKPNVQAVGPELEPLTAAVGPRLAEAGRFWLPLVTDGGSCVGGVAWGATAGEPARLEPQAAELHALAHAWALAVRTAQVREAARLLSEQLADANRRLLDAQEALAQTRAIKAVAEMAAGAAHEMNNPLAIIVGRAEMLASQLAGDAKLHRSATVIAEQGHRLSGIITDLMDFARPVAPAVAPVAVAAVVESAVALAKGQDDWADRTVVTTVPTNPPVPAVLADAAQVSAALAELVGNAVQATDARAGRVTVSAGHVTGSTHVAVTVTDNGCGMDEATARRAFDPFFSLRPAGRRRGLGLAKAQRVIEACGGSIRLDSRPGHGTTAVVLLPIDARLIDPPAVAPPERVTTGSA